jgi:ketosteroid isomerase-like protein
MFGGDSGAKAHSQPKLKTSAKVERVDVLSPDAAAVTTSSQTSTDSAGKTIAWGHVSTLVLKNIDGRWQVLQEHTSLIPESR